jgi:uncharacterized protein YxjI
MKRLESARQLTITQKKEWGEIFSGLETRNRYAVLDDLGNELYAAAEHSGSLLARLFLKGLRPFTLELRSLDGMPVLRIQRSFRLYFHEIEVADGSGRTLGTVARRFALLRRRYAILDAQGVERFSLFGPLLRPWTFWIERAALPGAPDSQPRGRDGKIAKKWSGLLKESFSAADQFGVEFPQGAEASEKVLLLAAVFLIDFVHFENRH